MDDGVHPADGVDLIGDASGLDGAAKVADHHSGRPRREIVERGGTLAGPRVQNDLMPLGDERPRGGASQTVGTASDEDASHRRRDQLSLRQRVREERLVRVRGPSKRRPVDR